MTTGIDSLQELAYNLRVAAEAFTSVPLIKNGDIKKVIDEEVERRVVDILAKIIEDYSKRKHLTSEEKRTLRDGLDASAFCVLSSDGVENFTICKGRMKNGAHCKCKPLSGFALCAAHLKQHPNIERLKDAPKRPRAVPRQGASGVPEILPADTI